jgi:hypothetical protein
MSQGNWATPGGNCASGSASGLMSAILLQPGRLVGMAKGLVEGDSWGSAVAPRARAKMVMESIFLKEERRFNGYVEG